MKIAVTGSSGTIGSRVVDQLASSGHEVLALDIRRPRTPLAEGVKFRLTDTGNRETIEPLLDDRGIEAIVHLGELNSQWADREDRVHARNAEATGSLFIAAAELGIERIAYASSCQVYGQFGLGKGRTSLAPLALPLTEDEPPRPWSAYGAQKIASELLLSSLARRYGVFGIALRLPMVLTRGHAHRLVHGGGRSWAPAGTEFASWISVEDAARAFEHCLTVDWPDAWTIDGQPGGYAARNLASPEPFWLAGDEGYIDAIRKNFPHYPKLPADWPDKRCAYVSDAFFGESGWSTQDGLAAFLAMAEAEQNR